MNYLSNQQSFLTWEALSHDAINFKPIYVDIAGDLVAGLLLSQLLRWHFPERDETPKIQVSRDDRLWVVQTRTEWWAEIRLKPRQVDRAGKILIKKGLVFIKKWRFNGSPTMHWRINWDVFLPLLEKELGGWKKDCDLPGREFAYTFTKEFQDLARGLLNVPGVYSFNRPDGSMLYVGRSIDLGRRIISSFKGRFLIYDHSVYAKYITTETASDAVLLEMFFITTAKPPLNGKFANDNLTLRINPVPDWSAPVLVNHYEQSLLQLGTA